MRLQFLILVILFGLAVNIYSLGGNVSYLNAAQGVGESGLVQVDGGEWFPFQIEWSGVDLKSGLLSGAVEAGSKGFVQVRDGNFYLQGERLRLFGVQVWPHGDKQEMKVLGKRFASLGFNLWRGRPRHACANCKEGLKGLDVYDRFFAQMKKSGLYHHMQIKGSGSLLGRARADSRFREFLGLEKKHVPGAGEFPRPGHFVPHDNLQVLSYLMHPDLVRAEQRWWKFILEHKNPYTGRAYKDEPAVLCMELLNETYILHAWEMGKLEPGALPEYYDQYLDKLWNKYLISEVSGQKSEGGSRDMSREQDEGLDKESIREWLVKRWAKKEKKGLLTGEDPQQGSVKRLPGKLRTGKANEYSKARTLDLMRFYAWLQKRYFEKSKAYLESIGCKVPVVGSNWSQLTLPGLQSLTGMDAVDTHIYYDMPSPQKKSGRYKNKSIYEVYGLKNLQSILATNALKGMPFCLSETNWAFPNEYQFQFLPELVAYASLQDWDALTLFYHPGGERGGIGLIESAAFMNDITRNPVLLSQVYWASRVFRDKLIAEGEKEVVLNYAEGEGKNSLFYEQSYLDSFKGDWVTPGLPYPYTVSGKEGLYNLPYEIALKHRVRKNFGQADGYRDGGVYWGNRDGNWTALSRKERIELRKLKEADVIHADTGQILSDQDEEVLKIYTHQFQSLTGRLEGNMVLDEGVLELDMQERMHGSVSVLALDGKKIENSGKILVSAVGRVRNTGMQWTEDRHHVKEWGTGPVLCEILNGRVKIGHDKADELDVWALDGGGKKMKKIESESRNHMVGFGLGHGKSVWYLIEFRDLGI